MLVFGKKLTLPTRLEDYNWVLANTSSSTGNIIAETEHTEHNIFRNGGETVSEYSSLYKTGRSTAKPSYSCTCLAALALISCSNGCLTARDIYHNIRWVFYNIQATSQRRRGFESAPYFTKLDGLMEPMETSRRQTKAPTFVWGVWSFP
jgi:hypothetical protein